MRKDSTPLRIKNGAPDAPGGRQMDEELGLSYLLGTGNLSRGDLAAIWRSYMLAVVGLCKDVDELKKRIEDSELEAIVADLIEAEWDASGAWDHWRHEALEDLDRQVTAKLAGR